MGLVNEIIYINNIRFNCRFIKFDLLRKFATERLQVDKIATGHFARTSLRDFNENGCNVQKGSFYLILLTIGTLGLLYVFSFSLAIGLGWDWDSSFIYIRCPREFHKMMQ